MFTTPRAVAKRQKNRVYFDYLQNAKSKTIAAPYVLRAYPGAPVATPLEWDEVHRGLHPSPIQHHQRRPALRPQRATSSRGVLARAATSRSRARKALRPVLNGLARSYNRPFMAVRDSKTQMRRFLIVVSGCASWPASGCCKCRSLTGGVEGFTRLLVTLSVSA